MRWIGLVLVFLLSCFGGGFGCNSGDSDPDGEKAENAASSGGAHGGGSAGEGSTGDGGDTSDTGSTGSGAGGTGGGAQDPEPSPGDGQSGAVSGGVTARNPRSASSDSASLRVSASVIDFYGIYQQYLPPHFLLQVDFEGDGVVVGHPPEVDHAEWLSVDQEDDDDTMSPVDIRFEMSSYGYEKLAPGDYETTIRVATGRLEGNSFIDEDTIAYVDIQVRLHLIDRITARPEALVAYARQGQPRAPGPSLSLGGAELEWSARSSESWLSFTPAEGTAPATVRTWIDASELEVGEHSAQVFIEEPDSEYRAVVELTLHVDARRMMLSHTGVALSAYPTAANRLSASVAVVDSAGLGLEWSATSNQDWLSAEPSDTDPSELVLSADPAGLEPGKVHMAEVVVTGDEPGVEDTEHIRVGLFVASVDPPEEWDFHLETFGETSSILRYVVDPVRPYVYLTSMDDTIRRYPLHPDLDDAEPTVFGDLGEQLGDLTISDDGSKLFVVDVGSEKLLVLPLPDPDEPLQIWDGGWEWPTFVRTFGRELVFGSDNVARDAQTGNPVLEEVHDRTGGDRNVLFAPTRHGQLIFASQMVVGSGAGPTFHEYAFGYSESEDRAWSTLLDTLGDGPVRDILTDDRGDWVADGGSLYERQGDVLVELRSKAAGNCPRDMTPAGAWTSCSFDLVRLYDQGGVELAQYTARKGDVRVARVSGDGTQLALLVDDFPDYYLSAMRLDRPDAE